MLCSICIATYKRPELLKELLDSILIQKLPDGIQIEVIIVDNDPSESAKDIVANFENNDKMIFNYYTQNEKNISITRNVSVKHSKGDYILFIDDDEIASTEWIKNLLETKNRFNADAVFGRVLSHFHHSTPEWIKNIYIFNRPSPPTGTKALYTRTGNCLIKSSLLKSVEGPFDPAYGNSGGEDTHLFSRLRKKGAKFVNCYEAWVSEYQPEYRTRPIYLIKRAFFTGNLYSRRKLEFTKKNKFFLRINEFSRSFLYLIISLLLTVICIPSKQRRLHWFTKIASNLGHILAIFGRYTKPY